MIIYGLCCGVSSWRKPSTGHSERARNKWGDTLELVWGKNTPVRGTGISLPGPVWYKCSSAGGSELPEQRAQRTQRPRRKELDDHEEQKMESGDEESHGDWEGQIVQGIEAIVRMGQCSSKCHIPKTFAKGSPSPHFHQWPRGTCGAHV